MKLRLRKNGLPRETTTVVCYVVTKQSSPLPNPYYLQRNRSIVLDVKKKNSSTIQQQCAGCPRISVGMIDSIFTIMMGIKSEWLTKG